MGYHLSLEDQIRSANQRNAEVPDIKKIRVYDLNSLFLNELNL